MVVEGARVAWIGDEAEWTTTAQFATTAVLDLGGRVVVPGLVNTHTHAGMGVHRGCCDAAGLFAWAKAIAPHTSTLSLDQVRLGCEFAVREMVRNGITTACDCTRYGAGVFSQVAERVGMRSLSGAMANSPSLRPNGRPNWPLALEETLAAMQEHSSSGLSRYYLGAHSPYSCTPELVVEVKQRARELDLKFVIHAAECQDEMDWVQTRYGCSPIQWLDRLGVLDKDTLLAHCVWADGDDLDVLAESGASVSHNPVSNAKLGSGVAPLAQMRKRGILVGLGTDSTLSNNSLNIFQEMKFSVLLQRAHGLDPFAIDTGEAIRMATSEGAHALGWGADVGSLQPGLLADLVVLDLEHPLGWTPERLLSDIVYAAGPQHVVSVMVGGEMIFDRGRYPRLEEALASGQP
jgi:5-methylthioadenosine/S-adenosylhomocysteine deaminase